MKIATVVFTYNRSYHTKLVLDSLSKNDVLPQKLFIFQDGLKCEEHRDEWEKVKQIIHSVNWCKCEVIEKEKNYGLAASIVSGINHVMQEHNAVIVLEDDCVTHPKFMRFVVDALKKYENNCNVYQVSGYVWPAAVEANGTDAYFTGRASSWGWATWKDRWINYRKDYEMLSRIKRDEGLKEQLQIWGEDLECFLLGNILGQVNSWLVFWALLIIEKGGYCLNPYESLVDNIGFDGSGVHCGKADMEKKLRDNQNLNNFTLPDRIEFPVDYEYSFRNYFKWISAETKLSCYNKLLLKWLMMTQAKKEISEYFVTNNISKIAIWGAGSICELLLKSLEGKVQILAIIESNPRVESFFGIQVVDLENLSTETELIVVIPIYDIEKIKRIVQTKTGYDIIALDNLIEKVAGH